MTTSSRGFVNIIVLIIVILALGGVVGYAIFDKPVTKTYCDPCPPPPTSDNTDKLVIITPTADAIVAPGHDLEIRWYIPKEVLASFPSDFNLGLFLNVINRDDPQVTVLGINDGTNDPGSGSVIWKVPTDTPSGTYHIEAYLSAQPKDPRRLCDPIESKLKDCAPSKADAAIISRANPYKANSAWFTISDSSARSVFGTQNYHNSEIGVSFDYPASWGSLSASEGVGCALDEQYYGREGVAQIKRDMALSPVDPCKQIFVGKGENGFPQIFATMSPLYAKYPIPKDGSWMFAAKEAAFLEFVKNLCVSKSEEDCKTYTTHNGILVSRNKDIYDIDGSPINVYFIHSMNPIFPGIVMSPGRLPLEEQKDFEQVVESLTFLP